MRGRVGLAVVLSGLAAWGCTPSGPELVSIRDKLGDKALVTTLPSLSPLKGEDGESLGLRAADCGVCHAEIYAEWRRSTHSEAFGDLQYLAEVSKSESPRWLCLNCHIPLQDQREYLVQPESMLEERGHDLRGLVRVANPTFDETLQRESITCATCHVRRGKDGETTVLARTASGRSPHPVQEAGEALETVCLRCHDPGPVVLTPTFFCWFETARERPDQRVCPECHMPAVKRAVVEGRPVRQTRRHTWAGGGVPKRFDGYADLLARGWKPGLELSAAQKGRTVTVVMRNAHAGHGLPTADPERFILAVVEGFDPSGKRAYRRARRYGQVWDWGYLAEGRAAKRIADRRFKAGETKRWVVELPDGIARVRVSAIHVRLTVSNARHMKSTVVQPELLKVWPDAARELAQLERNYPFLTVVAREEIGEGARPWTLGDLLAESAGLQGATLKELEALLAVDES